LISFPEKSEKEKGELIVLTTASGVSSSGFCADDSLAKNKESEKGFGTAGELTEVSDDPPVNKLLVVSEEVENGKLSSGEFLVVVWNELDKKSYPTSGMKVMWMARLLLDKIYIPNLIGEL
jgi:hypothetical protein